MTLNMLRWALALALLLLCWRTLRAPGMLADIRLRWRRYALRGPLGIGLYNSLRTSTPINVTLVAFRAVWSGAFSAVEWSLGAHPIAWSGALATALAYVATGPAILAYAMWGASIRRAAPGIGAFFMSLTPLFAALLSSAFLGEPPHASHALAFALIVGGIVVSARS